MIHPVDFEAVKDELAFARHALKNRDRQLMAKAQECLDLYRLLKECREKGLYAWPLRHASDDLTERVDEVLKEKKNG